MMYGFHWDLNGPLAFALSILPILGIGLIVTIEATTRYFPPMALASYQMRESDRVFFVRKPYKTLGGIFRKIRGIEMAMLTTASSGARYSTPPGVFDKG